MAAAGLFFRFVIICVIIWYGSDFFKGTTKSLNLFDSLPGYRSQGWVSSSVYSTRRPVRVAVIESKGCHDEVTAAVLGALGSIKGCQVDTFLKQRRYGIETIFDSLISHTMVTYSGVTGFSTRYVEEKQPDVVVLMTASWDLTERTLSRSYVHLFENTNAHLLVIVHHPDEFDRPAHKKMLSLWIDAKRVRFITLSPHVETYLQRVLKSWGTTYVEGLVSTFAPVFPLVSILRATPPSEENLHWFTIQGDLIKARGANRDWYGTFDQLGKLMASSTASSLELHLIGDGRLPKVPEQVKEKIKFHVKLPYVDFYQVLHDSTAILPAFANSRYLTEMASSSIPAALIAGVPLIADRALLSSYSFITEDEVFLRGERESELDVASRIAILPQDVLEAKRANVTRKNHYLYLKGISSMTKWIDASLL